MRAGSKPLQHLACVGLYVASSCLLFAPSLAGRVLPQPDILQYRAMAREAIEISGEAGEAPLWTGAVFGGMPTYLIHAPFAGNLVAKVDPALRLGFSEPVGRFIAAMLGFHLLLALLGASPWACLVGSLAFGLSTQYVVLHGAGHLTKLRAIAAFPLVASGVALACRRKATAAGLVFGIGLSLELAANHVQMTYYLLLTLAIWIMAQVLTDAARDRGCRRGLGRSVVALALGGMLAVACNAGRLWSVWEYAEHTTRGEQVLHAGEDADAKPESGLRFDEAMEFSHAPRDLAALLIPGAVGSSSVEPMGTALAESLATQPTDRRVPLYWGGLPFTLGPPYLGVVTLFLAVIGLLLVRGPVRWWVAGGVALTLALSLGRHLPLWNGFVFEYLPYYDRFRAPNSVAVVLPFLLAVPAGLAVDRLRPPLGGGDTARRAVGITSLAMGSAIVLFAAYETFGSALQHGSDAWSARAGMDLAALRADRLALLLSDAARSLGWLAAAALLVAFGLRGRGPRVLLPAALAALVAIDLATVGLRYLGWQRWVEPESIASFFAPRAVDREILADPVPGFRVLDLTVDPFNSARPALHHRIVGGYHAAKLRRMQDLIDHHLRRGSGPVLDMLDVRYRIERGGDGEPIARRNAGALGPAWLVDEIRWVGDSREELQSLADFDPARTAVVHREFATLLGDLDPSPGGRVEVLSHRPDDLLYRVESAGDALLVLSEVWYGPGAGWHAWVDGTPREIVRVNYVLRAVVVPAGRHDIRLAFTPSSFLWGRRIAAASSAALLITSLLVATRALLSRRGRRPGATIPPGSPTVRATGTTPDDG